MILTLNPLAFTQQSVDPIGPETELSNLASDLYIESKTEQALAVAEQSLQIARTVPTLVNTSLILEALGRFNEAFLYAEEAYHLNPRDKRTRGLYGEALLRKGDMVRGWPLYITSRNTRSEMGDFIREWKGAEQSLRGRRILVIEGEGYGDNIYFLRWLAPLRRWGAHVDYICQPSLAPLVRRLGYTAIENWGGNADFRFGDYDYYSSILTLPYKLGVTVENYRWLGPYIRVRRSKHPGTRVGICSLAGESLNKRRWRSLHASQLQPLMNSMNPKYKWVNLHHHYILPATVDHPKLGNWLDTTIAIASCDLVVTVDTCVAHLAGAMGIPCWVILSGASSWHYLLYRQDHPLYPSMKLIRNYGEGLDNAVEAAGVQLAKL